MKTKIKILMAACFASALLSGCYPTATSQGEITGSYFSPKTFKDFTCDEMVIEQESLSRREAQLTVAQEARHKNDRFKAWWGIPTRGDGIEASELANVRGQMEAVKVAISQKKCELVETQ